jgi:hypothetical protein
MAPWPEQVYDNRGLVFGTVWRRGQARICRDAPTLLVDPATIPTSLHLIRKRRARRHMRAPVPASARHAGTGGPRSHRGLGQNGLGPGMPAHRHVGDPPHHVPVPPGQRPRAGAWPWRHLDLSKNGALAWWQRQSSPGRLNAVWHRARSPGGWQAREDRPGASTVGSAAWPPAAISPHLRPPEILNSLLPGPSDGHNRRRAASTGRTRGAGVRSARRS